MARLCTSAPTYREIISSRSSRLRSLPGGRLSRLELTGSDAISESSAEISARGALPSLRFRAGDEGEVKKTFTNESSLRQMMFGRSLDAGDPLEIESWRRRQDDVLEAPPPWARRRGRSRWQPPRPRSYQSASVPPSGSFGRVCRGQTSGGCSPVEEVHVERFPSGTRRPFNASRTERNWLHGIDDDAFKNAFGQDSLGPRRKARASVAHDHRPCGVWTPAPGCPMRPQRQRSASPSRASNVGAACDGSLEQNPSPPARDVRLRSSIARPLATTRYQRGHRGPTRPCPLCGLRRPARGSDRQTEPNSLSSFQHACRIDP
jgi:hypothetical protein